MFDHRDPDEFKKFLIACFIAFLLAVAFAFHGCTPKASSPIPQLVNLHQVDATLFRSGQPTEEDYKHLKWLGIKTVLKLNSEQSAEEKRWAAENGIDIIEDPISGLWKPNKKTEAQIQQVLADPKYRPLLFHCLKGSDRTGLAAALYRVHEQHVSPEDAIKEWYALGHSFLLFTMDEFFKEHVK